MEPDCSCSSDTSYESDDSPYRRRTQVRKQKGKVKRRTPGRGRSKGRPIRKREYSYSTSSSDSSCTPPRRRAYWQKRSTQNSRTPPRRKFQTYASMNCSRNHIPASQRLEQYNRSQSSNGVSFGRRSTPSAVDGVEKYDVEFWGSDDDDLAPRFCQR